MSISIVGKRYASALFALGKEAGTTRKMSEDLAAFAKAWADNKQLRTVFENPGIKQAVRQAIVREIASTSGMNENVRDLLRLLSDRRRLRHIGEVAEAFEAMQQAASGTVRAEVTTAAELPESYFTELTATLKQITGRDVVIVRKTDPSLIGGVVTRIGDQVFDGSLAHRLSELKDELLRA